MLFVHVSILRSAIKDTYQNSLITKWIDFIYLPSIFKDRFVTLSIPDYFENKVPPIIRYKSNKPISNTIFKF